MHRLQPVLWLTALALMAVGGCGYSHQAVYPQQYRTVAIPIFENRTFYREVEFDLKEALTKEIERRTPYKVVAESHADTVLTGSIVSIDQPLLSRRQVGGLPQELEYRIVLDVEWTDQRDGRTIRQRRGLTAVGRYIPAREGGEMASVGQHHAVQNAADAIVSAMAADW
jgi:hypothetical protein